MPASRRGEWEHLLKVNELNHARLSGPANDTPHAGAQSIALRNLSRHQPDPRSDAPRSGSADGAPHPGAQSIALRAQRIKLEEYLDRGLGECFLRDPRIAALAESAMIHHHGQRFQMLAWTIMPNYVHVLVEVGQVPLSKIVQNWKSIVAVESNKLLGRTGRFWQPEYWDRFMRDEEQKRKAIRYIENNPVKANLCPTSAEWPFSSARFRDPQTRELKLPK